MPIVPLPLATENEETPCGLWCAWDDVTRCRTDLETVDEADQDWAIAIASAQLFKRTRRRYPGLCERTVAVCQECSCLLRWCRCDPAHRVRLYPAPVISVDQVTIDGVILDPSAYTLREREWLVRIDGDAWPLGSPLEDAAFQVAFTWGRLPPADGVLAAATLAAEYAAGCTEDLVCRLPKRLRELTKEGGRYVLSNEDTAALLTGITGLPEVDNFVTAELIDMKAPHGLFDPLAEGPSLRGV
jgi:hypothetical protein